MNTINGWSEIFVWSDKNLVWKKIWSEKHFGRKKNLSEFFFLKLGVKKSDFSDQFSCHFGWFKTLFIFIKKIFCPPPPFEGGGAKKFLIFFLSIFSPFQMILNITIFFQKNFFDPPTSRGGNFFPDFCDKFSRHFRWF